MLFGLSECRMLMLEHLPNIRAVSVRQHAMKLVQIDESRFHSSEAFCFKTNSIGFIVKIFFMTSVFNASL